MFANLTVMLKCMGGTTRGCGGTMSHPPLLGPAGYRGAVQ